MGLGTVRRDVFSFIRKSRRSTDVTTVKKFGTFGGVFTPDVLTILGVIMYLRLGWVVGNAGFLGALLIIILAKSVTICTGLSMSSITTNIKIGAGGAYSIISKSLGLEAGGSIGISLYIAQTLSAALYIIGFTEAWLRVFPAHQPIIVSSVAWMSLLIISYISAQLAIRVQYLIMTVIGVSLLSFFLSPAKPVSELILIGKFEDADFWRVFAVFFPAVTGIMAGANLSGDLRDPRRSIPLGTISAIIVTMVIYVGIAYFAGRISTPAELRTNQLIMVDKALWAQAVIAGIMGATLSSALGSMLGAPRILQALAEQKTVPLSKIFAAKTKRNEPRNAVIFTGIFIELALITGNLDFLASLITMFFLITYGILNLVVFLEQAMRIISFRPTFRVPQFVPLLGALQCIAMMFLIDPIFSGVSVTIIVILYVWLARRELESKWGDIRGGLVLYLVERTAKLAERFPRHQITWKPDLLLPIEEPATWTGPLLLIQDITNPSGSIFAFTVRKEKREETENALDELLTPLKEQGGLVRSTVIEDSDFLHGATLVIQVLRSRTVRPNILFLTIGRDTKKDDTINQLINQASRYDLGILVLCQHPRMAFGMQKDLNLWLRDKSPNWHLAVLVALQLQLNWGGTINLITTTSDKKDKRRLQGFLDRISDRTRLPSMTDFYVLVGSFKNCLKTAPRADINIFGLAAGNVPFTQIREITELSKSSCVFIKDSGQESALV
ncbi:MAG: Na-K-Cl cotransporter [Proteobacteria bacterium]|nr:Na-K-Cl cotransporter [candidate division Zixibacteria bacterium]NIQ37605.1 Na-K-Cl cotransporter [Pseudomonadota bacterium]